MFLRLRIYESKASVVTGMHGGRRCLSDERTGDVGQFFDWLSSFKDLAVLCLFDVVLMFLLRYCYPKLFSSLPMRVLVRQRIMSSAVGRPFNW